MAFIDQQERALALACEQGEQITQISYGRRETAGRQPEVRGPDSNVFDSTPRYIRNTRELGEYLHRDFMGQANVLAVMLLLNAASQ